MMAHTDETRTSDYPGSLDGVARLRIDCEQTDLAIMADPAMTNQVFLSPGTNGGEPSLIREGDEIIVYQRGRRRGGGNAPTLTVPSEGCPPITGSVQRGELYVGAVQCDVDLQHGQGDARFDGGRGSLTYSLGKGDVRLANWLGTAEVNVGAGDIHAGGLAAELAVALGKGDVTCDTISGPIGVKLGSGDISIVDSSGFVGIKSGSGDVVITRPRQQIVAVKLASGDVVVRGGSLAGMAIEVARGDIMSSAQLILGERDRETDDANDEANLVSRILRSKGVSFAAGDKGVRISRPGFELEAGDSGVRITKGGVSFVAGDQGVYFSTSGVDTDAGTFSAESTTGDIIIDLPAGAPVRVEALITGGDIRSDIPLVSVGRPGPRGATQRYVGVSDPAAVERIDLRLKAERGDIRLRLLPAAPPVPPAPPAPPTPPSPPQMDDGARNLAADAATARVPLLSREQQMRAILDALARGEVSVAEADRMLKALERGEQG